MTWESFYTLSRGPADAPTLVLLHGAGGSRLNWPAGLRRLPGATVYTLDLPGHGRSAGQARESIGAYAADVLTFLDATGLARAILVGHSMGGAIALTLALDAPGRVGGLVLVATGARLRVAPALLARVRTDFGAALDVMTRYAWAPGTPVALVRRGRERLREAGPEVLLADLTACDRFDVMDRLEEIEAPMLVVSGSADRLTPLKYARFLAERVAGARLVVVEEAGHMVMLERPAEVARVVGAWQGTSLRHAGGSSS